MKIVDSRKMAEIDRKTIEEYSIPSNLLMENAGFRVWSAFLRDFGEYEKDSIMVFAAGKGNNGGDACVMARQAYTDGFKQISILSWGTDLDSDGTGQKKYCSNLGIPLVQWETDREKAEELASGASVIFDGLTGTGLKGRARGGLEEVIQVFNRSKGRKIAVDIPSGLGDEYRKGYPAVKAEVTYTIGLPLISLYLPEGRDFCGRIEVVPICFPKIETENPELPGELINWKEVGNLLPVPGKTSWKGPRGHLHIYAGSRGTTGAAMLSSTAAARSLAGLVTLHIDSRVYEAAAGSYGSVMVRPWKIAEPAGEIAGPFLVGPGWGLDMIGKRKEWLKNILEGTDTRGVLDADGLTVFGRGEDLKPLGGRWIFTPHPGEFSRLTGFSVEEIMEDPMSIVLEYAEKTEVILVLKSHVIYLGFPDGRFRIIDGMNPAMGTGGSGDVLSGIIAGLLTAGAEPENAATAGVCLHQEAGRRARKRFGWFISEDILPLISELTDEIDE